MGHQEEYIVFIIVVNALILLLLLLLLINFIAIYRKQKENSKRIIDLKNKEISNLLRSQEVKSVNALVKGQEKERKRISAELHDRIGGLLCTALLQYGIVKDQYAEKGGKVELSESVSKLIGTAVDEVRNISHTLNEGVQLDYGLEEAICELGTAIERSGLVKVNLDLKNLENDKLKHLFKDVYRITQELFSNSLKHSKGTEVSLKMELSKGKLHYAYSDNGIGYDEKQVSNQSGIGLKNLADRFERLNGKPEVLTGKNQGYRLKVEFPVRLKDEAQLYN